MFVVWHVSGNVMVTTTCSYLQTEEIHRRELSDLQDLLEAARTKAAVEQSRAHR